MTEPDFELDLWGGVEGEEEAAKGQRGRQIPRRQFASQLLGLVLGSEPGSPAHSSTLLWEEGKEGPIAAAHPTCWLYTLRLCAQPSSQAARRSSHSPVFPSPLTSLR